MLNRFANAFAGRFKHQECLGWCFLVQLVGFGKVYAAEISQSLDRLGQSSQLLLTKENYGSANNSLSKEPDSSDQLLLSHIDPPERLALAKLLAERKDLEFATVIDPTSVVASNTTVSHGSYINSLVAIGANSTLGCHVFVNRSSSIAHDCTLESFVSTGPGAIICSDVRVGFGSFIGAGAVVKDGVRIGRHAFIGAGSMVIKDVADFEVVVGNPARVLKTRNNETGVEECPWCSN